MPIKLTENFRAVFYAPFYAIQALGFYARESVDVELMNSPAPAAVEPTTRTQARRLSAFAKSRPATRFFWWAPAIDQSSGSPIWQS
jgi:hypothetical protein